MIGAIAGDVLGSVYEAHTTKEKEFRLFHELSRPTDDSVLTIAVAATLVERAEATDGAGDDRAMGEGGAAVGPVASVADYARRLREFGRRYPNAGYRGVVPAVVRERRRVPRWRAVQQLGQRLSDAGEPDRLGVRYRGCGAG